MRQTLRLSSSVSLRPEPFGALVYDFHTRRLCFLKSRRLVDVVRRLDGTHEVDAVLAEVGIAPSERPAYVEAVRGLAATGVLTEGVAG